ncbi:hypothetical protein FRC12_022079 [Ceratobasidium sp. 428]|nr:hypothetical protein FRC12_022079 [Ceratobasidium sp. 428]
MFSNPVTSAFTQLEAAQNQLATSASTLHDACTTLYQAAIEPRGDDKYLVWLHNQLTQLTGHLNLFAITESKLKQSLAVLCRARNLSRNLVPINTLPVSVLSTIFQYVALQPKKATKFDADPPLHPLIVISLVCTSWRQLALDTPQLWTHIDFSPGFTSGHTDKAALRLMDRAVLWSQRAGSMPLHLHFIRYRSVKGQKLTPEMKGIMARAGSYLFSSQSIEEQMHEAFSLFNEYGRSERLKTIVVENLTMSSLAFFEPPESRAQFWSSCIPPTLTTLILTRTPITVSPDLNELMVLLSRTPKLRTLALRLDEMKSCKDQDYPDVSLPDLEHLELLPTNRENSDINTHLLRSIIPGDRELEARFNPAWPSSDKYHSWPGSNEYNFVIQKFFERSHVTCWRTTLSGAEIKLPLAQQLDCLPELRLLQLSFAGDGYCECLDALVVPVDGEGYRARSSKLEVLVLFDAHMDLPAQERLKRIIESHTLKVFVLGPRSYFTGSNGIMWDHHGAIYDWIRARVPHVECPCEIETDDMDDDIRGCDLEYDYGSDYGSG